MHLIQILLPLADNKGNLFNAETFLKIQSELTKQFGGLTAFTRNPAEGRWQSSTDTKHDDIIIFEVQTDALDKAWWKNYRSNLEKIFQQDEIIVRAQTITLL